MRIIFLKSCATGDGQPFGQVVENMIHESCSSGWAPGPTTSGLYLALMGRSGRTSALLDAHLPTCLGRSWGKYSMLPSFLSSSFSLRLHLLMDLDAIYPPRENQTRQPSALIHPPPFDDGGGGRGGCVHLGALHTGLGWALSVAGCKSSLPDSCLPSYTLFPAKLSQN